MGGPISSRARIGKEVGSEKVNVYRLKPLLKYDKFVVIVLL